MRLEEKCTNAYDNLARPHSKFRGKFRCAVAPLFRHFSHLHILKLYNDRIRNKRNMAFGQHYALTSEDSVRDVAILTGDPEPPVVKILTNLRVLRELNRD